MDRWIHLDSEYIFINMGLIYDDTCWINFDQPGLTHGVSSVGKR